MIRARCQESGCLWTFEAEDYEAVFTARDQHSATHPWKPGDPFRTPSISDDGQVSTGTCAAPGTTRGPVEPVRDLDCSCPCHKDINAIHLPNINTPCCVNARTDTPTPSQLHDATVRLPADSNRITESAPEGLGLHYGATIFGDDR